MCWPRRDDKSEPDDAAGQSLLYPSIGADNIRSDIKTSLARSLHKIQYVMTTGHVSGD